MVLIRDDQALVMLESQSQNEQSSQSSYWRQESTTFNARADGSFIGTTVLGTFAEDSSIIRMLAHQVRQFPFLAMGAPYGPAFWRILSHGRRLANQQGRIFSYDMLRQVFTLSAVQRYLNIGSGGDATLIIGDGFGVLTSLVLAVYPSTKIVSVNLNKSLLLDAALVRKAFPSIKLGLASTKEELKEAYDDPNISLILVRADDASILNSIPFLFAANVVSMQEMDYSSIEQYFQMLRENPAKQTFFYCCNRLEKTLYDGTVIRFNDYPWNQDDEILLNAHCPWNQWYYTSRPPFWRYRFGKSRLIWHRLARMKK